jgi:hypothetical protein
MQISRIRLSDKTSRVRVQWQILLQKSVEGFGEQ